MQQDKNLETLSELLENLKIPAMSIDQIQGYLTAIICGPHPVLPSQWLPLVFLKEEEMPELPKKEKAEKVVDLLFAVYNDISTSLEADDFGLFVPVLKKDDQETVIVRYWCQGFMAAVNQFFYKEWLEKGDTYIIELTTPIVFMSDPESLFELADDEMKDELKNFQKEIVERITTVVPMIWNYWRNDKQESDNNGKYADNSTE